MKTYNPITQETRPGELVMEESSTLGIDLLMVSTELTNFRFLKFEPIGPLLLGVSGLLFDIDTSWSS